MHRTISRIAFAFALAAATRLTAQVPSSQVPGAMEMSAPDPLHTTGQNATISLLTMGDGAEVWELFGHTAIWIHDAVTGRDTVFNWGVFDSRQPNFILHFLKGLMLYQMGGESLDEVLYDYRYFNRTVVSQQLALTTAQKDSLLHLIQTNALPQNRQYRYDYFRDNCSTRPRDLLDQVLGGVLHAHANAVTSRSYRWHALRLMQIDKPLVVGVDIGLGEPSDRPVTRWQEMFLPRELHDLLDSIQVRDSTGAARPLVVRESVLFQSTRAAEPENPPNLAPWLLAIGLAIAGVLAWVAVRARTGTRSARVTAAMLYGLWSLIAGLLGVVLTILWTVTDHVFAHRNENLLLFNPLWLVLAVLLPVYFLTGKAGRATRAFSLVSALLSVAAFVDHGVMLSRQNNLPIVALALPPALVIAWAVIDRFRITAVLKPVADPRREAWR